MLSKNKDLSMIIFFIVLIFSIICISILKTDNNDLLMQKTSKTGYYYNPESKVVYMRIKGYYGSNYVEHYSPNGNLYRYNIETNTFEEIIKEE